MAKIIAYLTEIQWLLKSDKQSKVKRYSFPCAQLIKHYAMKAYGGVDVYIHINRVIWKKKITQGIHS
jgi:hypothetical protein